MASDDEQGVNEGEEIWIEGNEDETARVDGDTEEGMITNNKRKGKNDKNGKGGEGGEDGEDGEEGEDDENIENAENVENGENDGEGMEQYEEIDQQTDQSNELYPSRCSHSQKSMQLLDCIHIHIRENGGLNRARKKT